MPLPHSLNEFLSPARSFVTRATWLDAAMMTANACAMLDSARGYIDATPETEEAFTETKKIVLMIRTLAAGGPILSDRDKAEFEGARQDALVAIDQLGVVLEHAKANSIARAMGMTWDDGSWC